MSNLTEIVDSLESSIGKLLDRQVELKNANLRLEKEMDVFESPENAI